MEYVLPTTNVLKETYRNIYSMYVNIILHTVSGNLVQSHVVLVGHVSKEGEDHKSREETG